MGLLKMLIVLFSSYGRKAQATKHRHTHYVSVYAEHLTCSSSVGITPVWNNSYNVSYPITLAIL